MRSVKPPIHVAIFVNKYSSDNVNIIFIYIKDHAKSVKLTGRGTSKCSYKSICALVIDVLLHINEKSVNKAANLFLICLSP